MQTFRRAQLAYAALALTDTWLAGTGRRRARRLVKPLLMPALAAVTATRPDRSATRPATYLALGGSWAGDVALLRPGAEAYTVGASAFGVGQTGWLAVYAPRMRPGGWSSRSAKVLAAVWLVGGLGVGAMAARKHPPLGVALPAYVGALSAVSVATLNLDPTQPRSAKATAAAGALLFLLSDGLIGVSQFALDTEDPRWGAAVMATYTLAQGLLEEGAALLP